MLPSKNWVGKTLTKKDNAHAHTADCLKPSFSGIRPNAKISNELHLALQKKQRCHGGMIKQVMMIAMIQLMIALTLLNHD